MNEPQKSNPAGFEVERAEEIVDAAGRSLGRFFTSVNKEITKRAALAREEVEDIWAEAQSLSDKHV